VGKTLKWNLSTPEKMGGTDKGKKTRGRMGLEDLSSFYKTMLLPIDLWRIASWPNALKQQDFR